MTGPDVEVLRHRAETLDAGELVLGGTLRCTAHSGRLFQQVRTAHVSHEEEITGNDAHRRVRHGTVGDHETHMLWRMTRSVQRFDPDVADLELASFVQQAGVGGGGPG